MSPLHEASREGNTELVKQLLDDGAPLDEKDEYGHTALMVASLEGHTEVVKLLLDKGAPVDEKGERGHTARRWPDTAAAGGRRVRPERRVREGPWRGGCAEAV